MSKDKELNEQEMTVIYHTLQEKFGGWINKKRTQKFITNKLVDLYEAQPSRQHKIIFMQGILSVCNNEGRRIASENIIDQSEGIIKKIMGGLNERRNEK